MQQLFRQRWIRVVGVTRNVNLTQPKQSVLFPNDLRAKKGWPASNDPTADSIAPPNPTGRQVERSGAVGRADADVNTIDRSDARRCGQQHRGAACCRMI
jgi:hypothetical protein